MRAEDYGQFLVTIFEHWDARRIAVKTPEGEPGLNYLCAAYKRFLHHVNPAMRGMACLALNRRSPAEIMALGVPGSGLNG